MGRSSFARVYTRVGMAVVDLITMAAKGPLTLLRAVLEVVQQKYNWVGVYVLVELWRYIRFRRHVHRIEHVDPFQPMSLSLSRQQHFRYCVDLLNFEPNPSANIRGFFQLSPDASLSRIPREAVLRALRFYLSTREESATASRNSRKYNKSVAFAVEVNGGVELDQDVKFSDVAAVAEQILDGWEQRDPKLQALSGSREETLRSDDNRLVQTNCVSVGHHPETNRIHRIDGGEQRTATMRLGGGGWWWWWWWW